MISRRIAPLPLSLFSEWSQPTVLLHFDKKSGGSYIYTAAIFKNLCRIHSTQQSYGTAISTNEHTASLIYPFRFFLFRHKIILALPSEICFVFAPRPFPSPPLSDPLFPLYQWTPLHRSARKGHTDSCRFLLQHGADVTLKTMEQWTPLHCACVGGHPAVRCEDE